jgi:hypothetical protein
MNTFWLKIAGAAVAVVGIIILVNAFLPKNEPKPQPKTVYDVWEKDDKRLRAEPQLTPPISPNQPVQPQGQQQASPQATSVEPPEPKFKEISEEEKIEAERLWEWVVTRRKMGRLPMMGYKQMVDTCREIIRRWPDSKYAFMAKRTLADIPERFQEMYHITKEEINLGNLK